MNRLPPSLRGLCSGLLVAAAMLANGAVLAAPLDEIRRVLGAQLAFAPSETALQALSERELAQGLVAIDPHARFIPAAEYRSPLLGPEAWTGIGASLLFQGQAVLLAIYQGGAADRVGVPDRSRLLSVDGQSVEGLTPAQIAERLRGKPDTEVRLGLLGPDGARLQAHVRRESFRPLDVELVEPGDDRVLRLREFIAGLTRPAMLATIEFLLRQPDRSPAQALVLDLREAVGGDLYEAFDLAGLFLPEGTLLGAQQARGGAPQPVRAPGGVKLEMPLVLLLGPETASAAEIFAGALQQHGRAYLIGQQTFGKCSSQTDVRLSDGAVLRLTNREILLPDGRSCSGAGLTPDEVVSDAELADLGMLMQRVRQRGARPSG